MKLTLTITIEVPDSATVTTTGSGMDINIERAVKDFNVSPMVLQCPPEYIDRIKPVNLPHKPVPVSPVPDEPLVKIRPGVKPLPGKLCVICGNRFQPKSSEKTCSEVCRKSHHKDMQKVYTLRYEEKKKMQQPDPTVNILTPATHEHRTVVLKSGERLCQHCKEPFKITKFEQHFCSDSCEALHGKNDIHRSKF